jgi:hypothetical protein
VLVHAQHAALWHPFQTCPTHAPCCAPQLALEYYMLAAGAMGGGLQARGALLRELLVESRAYGYLLGSGGAGEGGRRARSAAGRGWVALQLETGASVEACRPGCLLVLVRASAGVGLGLAGG